MLKKVVLILVLWSNWPVLGQDLGNYSLLLNKEEGFNCNLDTLIHRVSQLELLFDDAIALFESAEEACYGMEDGDSQALLALEFGKYLINHRVFGKGIAKIQQAIALYETKSSSKELMLCYKFLGIGYNGIGKKTESVAIYDTALGLAYDLKLLQEAAKIKNNIGIVYLEQSHFDKAIKYFKSSLEEDLEAIDRMTILGNLGLVESESKNYSQSEQHYLEALAIADSLEDLLGVLNIRYLLASLSFEKADFKSSLQYATALLPEYEKLGSQHDLVLTLNLIGLNYTNMGKHKKAVPYYQKGIALGQGLESNEVVWMYANNAFNEASMGNYKAAYGFLLTHLDLKDSIFSLENSKQIEEALAKYEAEKKEKEIVVLEAQQELQKQSMATQKLIRNIVFSGSAVIMIILIALIINYAQRLKSQAKLAEQHELINNQRILKLLKDSEIETIRASIKGQEEERIRLAKELHDGVAGSIAGIKFRLIKNKSEAKIIEEIDKVYNEVRDLSHGLTSLKVANEPLVSLIEQYIQSWNLDDHLKFELIVSPGIDFDGFDERFKIDFYRIIQELISNVFKHADATFAELQITKNEDSLNIILEDNGKGFDDQNSVKGIGINNIKHRVESHDGKVFIDSVLGRGTIINIDLAINEALHSNM